MDPAFRPHYFSTNPGEGGSNFWFISPCHAKLEVYWEGGQVKTRFKGSAIDGKTPNFCCDTNRETEGGAALVPQELVTLDGFFRENILEPTLNPIEGLFTDEDEDTLTEEASNAMDDALERKGLKTNWPKGGAFDANGELKKDENRNVIREYCDFMR